MERHVTRVLTQLADPVWARGAQAYFKQSDDMAVLGVKTPSVRSLVRDVERAVRGTWDVADAIVFCDRLSRRRHHEQKMVGVLVLGRFHARFPRTLYGTAKRWITAGRFRNWAAIERFPESKRRQLLRRTRG
jgi:hypothetical protein